jgi:hypothetical protein
MTAMTAKKLEKSIEKALLEWLLPLGFYAEDGGGCARWKDDVYVYIGCVVTRIGGVNRVKPVGQMGFKSSQRIYQAFMHDKSLPSPNRSVDLQADYAHFARSWSEDMRCQSVEDLDVFLDGLRVFVLEKLYPTLNSYTEPSQVVELYLKYDETNRACLDLPGWHGYSSALKALILARLYRAGVYESLRKRYQPVFEQLMPEYKERVIKLITYLDQRELPHIVE